MAYEKIWLLLVETILKNDGNMNEGDYFSI